MNNLEKFNLITWTSKNGITDNEFYISSNEILLDTNFLQNNNYKRVNMFDIIINIPITNLPNSLEYLELPYTYNFEIDLPLDLLVLKFGDSFNKKINYPNKIFYIRYGNKFNQPVYNLPFELEFLIFGLGFNQPIENLPNKLKLLYLGFEFNKSVDFLPENLLYLNLSEKFNQTIDNLPSSLVELTFCYSSPNYRVLDFTYHLIVIKEILNLSDNLDNEKKILYSKHRHAKSVEEKYVFNQSINNLPNNLQYLLLPSHYNTEINNLPKKIKYISFGEQFNRDISFLVNYKFLELLTINYNIKDIYKIYKSKSKEIIIDINSSKKIKIKNIIDIPYFRVNLVIKKKFIGKYFGVNTYLQKEKLKFKIL